VSRTVKLFSQCFRFDFLVLLKAFPESENCFSEFIKTSIPSLIFCLLSRLSPSLSRERDDSGRIPQDLKKPCRYIIREEQDDQFFFFFIG